MANLKDYINKKVVCIYWSNGERIGTIASLTDVIGNEIIKFGDVMIPLWGVNTQVQAIIDCEDNNNFIYYNKKAEEVRGLPPRKEEEPVAENVEDTTDFDKVFSTLELMIGKGINCKYFELGEEKMVFGLLTHVEPFDSIGIDSHIIEFVSYIRAIEEITDLNGNVIYHNAKAHGYKGVRFADKMALINLQRDMLDGHSPEMDKMSR